MVVVVLVFLAEVLVFVVLVLEALVLVVLEVEVLVVLEVVVMVVLDVVLVALLEVVVLEVVLEVTDGVLMIFGSSTAGMFSAFAELALNSVPPGLPDSSPAPLSFLRCCRFSR